MVENRLVSDNKTSVRLDDELQRAVKMACIQRDVTQTEAITAGLRMWLRESGEEDEARIDAGLNRKQRELLLGFAEMLRSGGGDDDIQRETFSFADRAVRLWLKMRREAGGN